MIGEQIFRILENKGDPYVPEKVSIPLEKSLRYQSGDYRTLTALWKNHQVLIFERETQPKSSSVVTISSPTDASISAISVSIDASHFSPPLRLSELVDLENSFYDANDNRLSMLDATGTATYGYDNLDRLTRTTYPNGKNIQATYDRVGNRATLTNPGGLVYTHVYDAGNRLTQIAQGTRSWTFIYDGAGNRTRLYGPNGIATD